MLDMEHVSCWCSLCLGNNRKSCHSLNHWRKLSGQIIFLLQIGVEKLDINLNLPGFQKALPWHAILLNWLFLLEKVDVLHILSMGRMLCCYISI